MDNQYTDMTKSEMNRLYEKYAYVQKHKHDIDKCIVEAWDKSKPKEGSIASWTSLEHPEYKGTTIPLTTNNINSEFGRRFYAKLSTTPNLFIVKF